MLITYKIERQGGFICIGATLVLELLDVKVSTTD